MDPSWVCFYSPSPRGWKFPDALCYMETPSVIRSQHDTRGGIAVFLGPLADWRWLPQASWSCEVSIRIEFHSFIQNSFDHETWIFRTCGFQNLSPWCSNSTGSGLQVMVISEPSDCKNDFTTSACQKEVRARIIHYLLQPCIITMHDYLTLDPLIRSKKKTWLYPISTTKRLPSGKLT